MIYILTYSMIMPETPTGQISGLFEDAFSEAQKAERAFNNLVLTPEFFRKELWTKDDNGRKKMLKEKRFDG